MFLFTPGVGVEHFFLVDPNWNVSLAPTPSVGVVHIYVGVRESRSWEHDKSLNKGQQDLTRLNTKQAACVESIKNPVKHIWLR